MATQRTLTVKLVPDVASLEAAVAQVKKRVEQQTQGSSGSGLTGEGQLLPGGVAQPGQAAGGSVTNLVAAGLARDKITSGLKGFGEQLNSGGGVRGGLKSLVGGLRGGVAALGAFGLAGGAAAGAIIGLGAAGIAASKALNTTAFRQNQAAMRQLSRAWNAFASRIGDAILPILTSFARALTNIINFINRITGGDEQRGTQSASSFNTISNRRPRPEPEPAPQRNMRPRPEPEAEPGELPQLARGGIVRPRPGGTPVVVGEGSQPEAVVPFSQPTNFGDGYHEQLNIVKAMRTWWQQMYASGDLQALIADITRQPLTVTGGGSSANIPTRNEVQLTETEYNALTNKSPATLYIIVS